MKRHITMQLLLFVFTFSLLAQDWSINGVVTSAEDSEGLPGVTVRIKGQNTGTATDLDGKFTLMVSRNQILQFSCIGFESQEVTIRNNQPLKIKLSSSSQMLDEVVAIGYGVMKKSDLTGAVTSVKADQLKKTPAAGLDQALQGRAAGVTVNSSTGQPGAAAEVRIRGIGTVNNSSPIYVVDGIISSDINYLHPNDIASLEVLKDASATAIYGSRAANGVILVTTKSGSKDRSDISFNAYVGIQNRWRKLDLMKRDEFVNTLVNMKGTKSEIKYLNDKGFNAWLSAYRLGSSDYYPVIQSDKNPGGFDFSAVETDWQDEVFEKNALVQNYHLAVNGNMEKADYSFSGSYYNQDGTIIGSNFERFTLRANTSFKVRDWLRIGENMSFISSTGRYAMNNSTSAGASILSAALAMAPWDPVRYPAGTVNRKGADFSDRLSTPSNFRNVTNPYSMVYSTTPKNKTERFIGNIYFELTPFKGFIWRSEASMDHSYTRDKSFTEKHAYSDYDKNEKNFLSAGMARYSNVMYTNTATYNRDFEEHRLGVMLGQSTEEYNFNAISGSGASILNPTESNWYLSQTTEERLVGEAVGRNRRFSLFGRANYSYKNRYMATATMRIDKTSKFPENPRGYFPSAALGWRISEEDFMRGITCMDFMKLRAGWGRTGNDQIGDNSFNQTMFNAGPSFVDYVLGLNQQLVSGATVLYYINRGGIWETTEQWNAGVDFGFFNGMLTGNVDLFLRDTKQMLLTVKGPAHTGNRYDAQANVGTVRNKGIELALEHANKVGEIQYSVSGNVSFIKNKLTALNGGQKIWSHIDNVVLCDEGLPLYTFWGYNYQGIYQTNEEAAEHLYGYDPGALSFKAGDAKYEDRNHDGIIDDKDKMNLGNPFPWLTYGINLSLEWRGIDFQAFFQGVYGNKIYNQVRYRTEGKGEESTLGTRMRDVWGGSGDNSVPNPYGTSRNYDASSRFIEDGAYFRLKNIQLGYTLPSRISRKAGMERCRIYVSGNNIFTLTDYTGYDPEVGGGVDYGNYPQARTMMLGVNINF